MHAFWKRGASAENGALFHVSAKAGLKHVGFCFGIVWPVFDSIGVSVGFRCFPGYDVMLVSFVCVCVCLAFRPEVTLCG